MNGFADRLIEWFRQTGRNLPWRKTYDPYHVWISEVMLQQTQMERGVDYFNRWVNRFPDIESVAGASETEILKMWEGLGYYARARNLHAAAKLMVANHGSEIPCSHEALLALPGIGPYTSAAIGSIACNLDLPAIDANVARVYARIFDIDQPVKAGNGKRVVEEQAGKMLPAGKARLYNQALMDLGGLVCLPRSPRCRKCPVIDYCKAHTRGTVGDRPVAVKPKEIIPIEMATGILGYGGTLFIQQRNNEDIWGGLWEFPGGQVEAGEDPADTVVREYREETGYEVARLSHITTVVHYHTHYRVTLHSFSCCVSGPPGVPELTAAQAYKWVTPAELDAHGFPSGHKKVIEFIRTTGNLMDGLAGGMCGN